jgi:hypothetical protein
MWSKLIMAVAWPAFLAACLLEAVVFAVVDPLDLSWGDGPLGWSRQAVYTVAFFIFWAVALLSSLTALTLVGPGGPGRPEPLHE